MYTQQEVKGRHVQFYEHAHKIMDTKKPVVSENDASITLNDPPNDSLDNSNTLKATNKLMLRVTREEDKLKEILKDQVQARPRLPPCAFLSYKREA